MASLQVQFPQSKAIPLFETVPFSHPSRRPVLGDRSANRARRRNLTDNNHSGPARDIATPDHSLMDYSNDHLVSSYPPHNKLWPPPAKRTPETTISNPSADNTNHLPADPTQLRSKRQDTTAAHRLSMLRRITISPLPDNTHLSPPTKGPAKLEHSPQDSAAVASTRPLYLALNEALSRPLEQQKGNAKSQKLVQASPMLAVQESSPESGESPQRTSPVISRSVRAVPLSGFDVRLTRELPSVASDLSSLFTDESRFSGDTSMSGPAEQLFRSLSVEDREHRQHFRHLSPHPSSDPAKQDQLTKVETKSSKARPTTWKQTLSEGGYQALLVEYDLFEMHRQEVIWELCRSEEEFNQILRSMLGLFVQPLRAENGTEWIPGLDSRIARLFDWLDDIAQLHAELLAIMEGCRANQLPIVIQIGESLRPIVSRLEIYQPYVVRVDEVSAMIEDMMLDPLSDFGEFVRIQCASPDCPSSLPELLHRPIERLKKYPAYFKQIFSLTSRRHPDHLSMFSLLHGTEMMIRVLQGVKKREEEYEAIRSLADYLQGMPLDFVLPTRERHLIGQGPLLRVHLDSEAEDWGHMPEIDYTPVANAPSFDGRFTNQLSPKSSTTSSLARHPSSRSALRNQDGRYPSINPQEQELSPSITHRAQDRLNIPQPWSPSDNQHSTEVEQPEWIYAFIFTDLVILSRHEKYVDAHGNQSQKFHILPGVGVSRVIGFREIAHAAHDHLIGLELLPLQSHNDKQIQPVPVYLSLAERNSGRMALAPHHVLSEARKQWSEAFSRCFVYTMRSLSFPATYDSRSTKASGIPTSIMTVLTSDKPLPKSPSAQLLDHDLPPVEQERQERDWWSARFQQVLEELSTGTELDHLGTEMQNVFTRQDGEQGEKRGQDVWTPAAGLTDSAEVMRKDSVKAKFLNLKS
ncbi:hypothetical protein DL93DRAFT_1636454 [Clavulina sp. PMI_390]|nr:hypothetical protein DL93DRAFT_1636454 [Clavulina sp. PMI_390]